MYERFTDRAQKVTQLANDEAHRINHDYIGTEHILLGLVKEGSGVAANVLKNLDIDLRRIRLEVEKLVPSGPDRITMGKLPQTPRAKKVIEYAMEESRNLNHNYVGTEHLLLGLLREQEGVAAQVLMNLGLKLEEVREVVLALLGHSLPESREQRRNLTMEELRDRPVPLPAACPKCGQSKVVRVLWNWVHLWGDKEEEIRSGKAILGNRYELGGPPWVCLDCSPGWSEVHRLATQEWQWQLAKEEAIAAAEFEKAAWYRDAQDELRRRLTAVVKELSGK